KASCSANALELDFAAIPGLAQPRRVEPTSPARRLRDQEPGEGRMNNCSLVSADRMTHVRIVAVSLLCATVVAGIGVTARMSQSTPATAVVKPVQPMTAASGTQSTIR